VYVSLRVAVIGAGIGGLAAAMALGRVGIAVHVFEQARAFRRVGAAINLTPNAVKVLDGLGLSEVVRERAYRPQHRVSRTWDSGVETSRLPMGATAEARYGAPQLTTHRADLLAALEAGVTADAVQLGQRAVAIEPDPDGVRIAFADGSSYRADAVVGADGIHSTTRQQLFGDEAPRFTGMVALRSIVSAELLAKYDLSGFTKWWGPTPQSQLVTFLINRGHDLFMFATLPQAEAPNESWSAEGDIGELRAGFACYAAEARDIVASCDHALKTALYERDPLPRWSVGNVTLLGDACHPMMPFMAQGAAMGLEDAAVLARCLAGVCKGQVATALAGYERARLSRTARVQLASRENEWLRTGIDADWVYGYDAWQAPLSHHQE
jgi:salicylate hydroxylase